MASLPIDEDLQNGGDAVCVVGIGCRYPGDKAGVQGFWDTITKARSTHSQVPKERWNPDAFYHPNHERVGTITTKGGYFLNQDLSHFDAPFFSITAFEAAGMDPQQRLLLELAYETFENAGVNIADLKGSKTGCYVGSFANDYIETTQRDVNDIHPYSSTGNGKSMLANRVSWFYDLRGPSIMIDTACSSSMYAFHLACQSIRLGEIDQGIVGGSNIILAPTVMRSLSAMRFLSPTGKCHSYSQEADGYARGEGVGMILLKRLSKAIADGDTIRAIIRSSGVNQDGKTPGITMPSAVAQADLIRECYTNAGISMDQTAYFEGHGTGTLLGDPIELQALGSTFGTTRTMDNPLYVGSVKANIGHQEGGAGVAGVIRAVLAVEQGIVPPNAELEKVNSAFKLEEWKIALPTEPLPWPTRGIRRISVNSFGYGGANSHAIIDDAYHYMLQRGLNGRHNTVVAPDENDEYASDSGFSSDAEASATESSQAGVNKALFAFSASDQAALGRLLPGYMEFLEERIASLNDSAGMVSDLAYTLAKRRTVFDHRVAFAAGSLEELIEELRANPAPKTKKVPRKENVAFIFTGQGAQYCQMGRELLAYDVFRQSLAHSQKVLDGLDCEWNLVEELMRDEATTRVNLPRFSQPLCTAIQLAQVQLLRSWGVTPKATVGHSSGEIGAAYASGKISHDDAMSIAYHRGRFSDIVNTRRQGQRGAMLAVGLSAEQVAPYVGQVRESSPGTPAVVVACINSPQSVTLSGDFDAIRQIEANLKEKDVFARGLKTSDTAYHSPHMSVIAGDYLAAMANVKPLVDEPGSISMFSSVSGTLVASAAELDASYWVANMLQTVKFHDAVHAMLNHTEGARKRRRPGSEFSAFVEIGPSAALKGPLNQILAEEDSKMTANIVYTSVLHRGQPADTCALNAMAKLWAQGSSIDFATINQHLHTKHDPKVQPDLPAYPWNHGSRMWHDTTIAEQASLDEARTDLLGQIHGFRNMNSPVWRNVLRIGETPWLADHKIHTSTLLPGTSMIIMALEAARKQVERGRVVKGYQFRDVALPKALSIPADGTKVEVQLYVRPFRLGTRTQSASWFEFSYVSLDDQKQWNENCFGQFRIVYETEANEVDAGLQAATQWAERTAKYADIKQRLYQGISKAHFYKVLRGIGMNYGPTFQALESLYVGDEGECHSVVEVPDTASVMPHQFEQPHLIHPATLDVITQTLFGTKFKSTSVKSDGAQVPVNIGKLYIAADLPSGVGAKFVGYSTSKQKNMRETVGQIVMSDEEWSEPKIVYEDFVTMSLNQVVAGQESGASARRKCARLQWVPDLRHTQPSLLTSSTTTASKEAASSCDAEIVDMVQRTLDELRDQRLPSDHLEHFMQWSEQLSSQLEWVDIPADAEVDEALAEFPERLGALISSGKDHMEALTDEVSSAFAKRTVSAPAHPALDAWFDAIYLNNPNTTVLLLGDGSASSAACHVARTHIARAGQTDRLHRCILAELDETIVHRTKAVLDADKVQMKYTTFNPIESAAFGEDTEPQGFDLIVAPPSMAVNGTALARIKSVMSPSGTLLVSGSQEMLTPSHFLSALSKTWWTTHMGELGDSTTIDADQNKWESRLRAAGVDGKVGVFACEGDITISVVPQPSTEGLLKDTLSGQRVVLIEPDGATTTAAAKFQDSLKQQLEQADCTVAVASLGDEEAVQGCLAICLSELSDDVVANMSDAVFCGLQRTVTAASQLVWFTHGGAQLDVTPSPEVNLDQSMAAGLLRSIRSEVSRTLNIHLDISSRTDLANSKTAELALRVICTELPSLSEGVAAPSVNHDRELAIDGDSVFVPRVMWDDSFNLELAIPSKKDDPIQETLYQPKRALQYIVGNPGRFDSLHWIDDVKIPDDSWDDELKDDEVEVQIMAWSLNFMDIMAAMGQIPTTTLGLEIAGVVTRCGPDCTMLKPGMRVVMPRKPSFLTHLRVGEKHFEEVPDDMDLATAASICCVYTTAYVGLITQGRLQKGETILIHAAAGGVGQAVLQMAQWIGAEIYCTVGSNSKKQLLMDRYNVPEDRIFSSRDLTFADGIMRATNGKGVDVVVNSLAGEALRVTWNCIAPFGRFIEVGKRDILGNVGLEMAPFLRQVTFASVNVEAFEEIDSEAFLAVWHKVWALVREGVVGPVYPINKFSVNDAEKAFRFMASGAHSGKVVVTAEDDVNAQRALQKVLNDDAAASTESPTKCEVDERLVVPVMPSKPKEVVLDPSATYVLCGGLGGIGRSTAQMMAEHGAKHLVFLSRSGATKTEHHNLLKDLDKLGVRADALVCDATDAAAVASFVALSETEGWKIKGLIQCAMVLRDRMFENMIHDDWVQATKAKVQGTKNLSDALPTDMDFFIMLSSLSGVIGNPGQANYSAANTYMDALAYWRRSHGQAATAIDLGVVADAGYLAENPEQIEAYAAMAPLHITESDLLMLLSAAMKGHTVDGQPVPGQLIAGFGKEFLAAGSWQQDNKFAHALSSSDSVDNSNAEASAIREAVSTSPSIREAGRVIQDALLGRLGRALNIDPSDIDASKPLHDYGVDSLVAVEIRNWVFRELAADVTVFDLISPMPVQALALKIASLSGLLPKSVVAETIEEVTKELNSAMPQA